MAFDPADEYGVKLYLISGRRRTRRILRIIGRRSMRMTRLPKAAYMPNLCGEERQGHAYPVREYAMVSTDARCPFGVVSDLAVWGWVMW